MEFTGGRGEKLRGGLSSGISMGVSFLRNMYRTIQSVFYFIIICAIFVFYIKKGSIDVG